MTKIKYLTSSLIILSVLSADNGLSAEFEHITIKDGLSQSTVNCIIQDSNGFLWIGTQDGLNRYDGYNIKIFRHDPADSTTISANYVNTIFEDSQGRLWIGTEGAGIAVYDPGLERFTNFRYTPGDSTSLSDNYIYSIIESADGTIWIGSSEGLNKFIHNTNQFEHYARSNRDSIDSWIYYIFKIAESADGFLWICTYDGLSRFDPELGQFTNYNLNINNNIDSIDTEINTFMVDDSGILWLGTNSGLVKLDTKTGDRIIYQQDLPHTESTAGNGIISIFEDNANNLWFGSYNGLNRLDIGNGTITRLVNDPEHPNTINDNYIPAIYQDNAGVIWVGTGSGGLNKYDPGKRKFPHHFYFPNGSNQLNNNSIYDIFEDNSGAILIGTDGGGVNKYDPANNSFTYMMNIPDNNNSIASNSIGAIGEDLNGNLWIGFGEGVDLYNPQLDEFRHFKMVETDSSTFGLDGVFSICRDSAGTMWFGSYGGGLSKYDPIKDTFYNYTYSPSDTNSISGDYISTIYCDNSGELWIGTSGGEINRFDYESEHFIRYLPLDNQIDIYTIHNDARGKLWIGTHGYGLVQYDLESKKKKYFTTNDGLASNVVYGILADAEDNLWLSTNSGLSKFDPDKLSFHNFDYRDGLQSNEFNQGAAYKTKSGVMYFGGINGFNAFRPSEININPFVPKIVLTDFYIFNERVKPGSDSPLPHVITNLDKIDLTYQQNAFSIHYSALNFSIPEKNKYRYILVGYDKDWVNAGNSRVAKYMNLHPGAYTFQVTGSNNDGIWNDTGARINIFIKPPFWQTALFRVFGLLLVFSSLFYIISRRLTNIRRRNQRLEQIVLQRTNELKKSNDLKNLLLDIITHDLRNPIGTAQGFAEMIVHAHSDIEELLYMKDSIDQSLHIITNVTNLAKIEVGDQIELTNLDVSLMVHEVLSRFKRTLQ
ncbi:MAG: histidine kinase [Candidatus Marinimicrobia bacterium]|nr:histidine kinase [Candidatus Neomarinimicrobiota bacterium]